MILFDTAKRPETEMDNLQILQEAEACLAEETLMEMDLIRKLHPDWFARCEEIELCVASSHTLSDLIKSAPNSFAKGLIGGILTMRLSTAAINGTVF